LLGNMIKIRTDIGKADDGELHRLHFWGFVLMREDEWSEGPNGTTMYFPPPRLLWGSSCKDLRVRASLHYCAALIADMRKSALAGCKGSMIACATDTSVISAPHQPVVLWTNAAARFHTTPSRYKAEACARSVYRRSDQLGPIS
jgi:hypothetical protein